MRSLGEFADMTSLRAPSLPSAHRAISTPRRRVAARTPAQAAYIAAMARADLVFALGPAGCGKTYLAAAAGVAALTGGRVEKLILSRPALEAGERLGFLPGDLREKADPYLRPLTDALADFLPPEKLTRYLEAGTIEVAPLAFMRGRTFARAAIILDEAQNCTREQIKMALTRIGEGAWMVVAGDPSGCDLAAQTPSGLSEAARLTSPLAGTACIVFSEADVQRHDLVAQILRAYASV